ncbi:PREDICTED: homeobox-leucine zipper protein ANTHOCYANINLESS 2 isoform X1 [Tarenaya hassleriana]|uniref:homeobox-leucine zipper protein ANTHOCYANINLESS 2 isoform X1 n=1 Tax=Tarenaya hassleriana TaxID=28532 RepID=UPI00053C7888|nr:PREDICTED: homeobox-leucine zipper protein ANTHOCYANINLESS 2 isoform X1 [Tarenaya hassleriana]
MNFGGLLDNSSGGGGGSRILSDISYVNHPNAAAAADPRGAMSLFSPPFSKSVFSSPGLSLAIVQPERENRGEASMRASGDNLEGSANRRSREEEHESRSGSDNVEGISGDDQDAADKPPRKKRYHRHTPQQIQELEAMFKECPHPDEKQRLELSKRLCLETRQVKFWFQNRRTQMKTQLERHENALLRQENDKLRAENMSIREAMRNPICSSCGGPAMLGDVSLEEQHLRIENARLKDELDRVCALAGKFLGRSISGDPPLPNSSLELGVGTTASANAGGFGFPPDFGISSTAVRCLPTIPPQPLVSGVTGIDQRSVLLELALTAMDELVKLAQTDEPLWVKGLDDEREILNQEEYVRSFPPTVGLKPAGFVTEASRTTGMVIINSLALVETLMDSNRWTEMFPCIISRASTTDVISGGMAGTRNGAIQLMHAELQVLSPLVPVREANFLRFCKQHAEGVWAVVDVSVDGVRENSGCLPAMSLRRLPSGCVVQDMPNGYSKVTWVEHAEYEENQVHQLYRPMLRSGLGFGAQRWVATLQRQCECLAILMSSSVNPPDNGAITAGGRKSMLKLAQRMTYNFCSGISAPSVQSWSKLTVGHVGPDVRVMTRKSVDDPGEPPGIVLSAATSVWVPGSPQRLFDFLRDERLRCEWDILSNGGPMQEMAHIAKGQDEGNSVCLLRSNAMNASQSSMLILQETRIDASGALVVYAPVDIPAMHVVMNGGDSSYVALLPSGFAILPDGGGPSSPHGGGPASPHGGGVSPRPPAPRGSLLTVAFQILVNSLPTAKLTVESVETVNNLITCTVQKIRAALHSDS